PCPAGGGTVVNEWQPVELDAEQEDQQQAREEGGDAEPDKREGGGDVIEPRVLLERGDDADRNRDQHADQVGGANDAEGDAKPVENVVLDGDARGERLTPV